MGAVEASKDLTPLLLWPPPLVEELAVWSAGLGVMPLTLKRLCELRADSFAVDLPADESMCGWTEDQAVLYYESGGVMKPDERRCPRVWVTSDVHTDRENNMEWCRRLPRHPYGDVLIVAGDLSHRLDIIEETLKIFLDRFTRGAPPRRLPNHCAPRARAHFAPLARAPIFSSRTRGPPLTRRFSCTHR